MIGYILKTLIATIHSRPSEKRIYQNDGATIDLAEISTSASGIPRTIGPRSEICEQTRAANRWPSPLSSGGYRGSALRHRACEEQSRPSAFAPDVCDPPAPPASDT